MRADGPRNDVATEFPHWHLSSRRAVAQFDATATFNRERGISSSSGALLQGLRALFALRSPETGRRQRGEWHSIGPWALAFLRGSGSSRRADIGCQLRIMVRLAKTNQGNRKGSYWPFSACRLFGVTGQVGCKRWSAAMQLGGQVRCNYAQCIPPQQLTRTVPAPAHPGRSRSSCWY